MSIDYSFKIISVGSSGVGKTSIIRRFAEDKFEETYIETLGVDFAVKRIHHNNYNFELKLFDTAGQERFGTLRPYYYRGANGAIIVFDLTRRRSFDLLSNWLNEIYINCGLIPYILVGNKSDIYDRQVELNEAQKFAECKKLPYFETSAKTGENIINMYIFLANQIMVNVETPSHA